MKMAGKRGKYNVDHSDPRLEIDGYKFDSVGEAKRYGTLKLLARAGEIANLEVHPAFPIYLGRKSGTGEVLNYVCEVELDFSYELHGGTVYEDFKGRDLPLSRLKRKLVEAAYGFTVTLVRERKR